MPCFNCRTHWTYIWTYSTCEPTGHTALEKAGVPSSYLFNILLAGYRPILDAMKTFAKSSDPIDIEVYKVILFAVQFL